MKKFCNKLSKQQWRVSVPNFNFRKSDASNSDTENTYNFDSDIVVSSENSGSYLTINSETSDKPKSVTNSVIISEETSDSSDQESKYEDASPMFDKKIEITNSEQDFDQNLYADIENSFDISKEIDELSDKFVYDIPKISFSFFEDVSPEIKALEAEDYEVVSIKPRCSTPKSPKLKSEVKIILATPPPVGEEEQENQVVVYKTDETTNMGDTDDISLAETHCDISTEQKIVEFDVSEIIFNGFSNNLSKSESVCSLNIINDNQEDDDDGLYKVPTKTYKRLSQSLTDLNKIIETETNIEELKPNTRSQIIEHNVILKKNPSEEKIMDQTVQLDYCNARSKLPVKIRRATLLRRPQMRILPSESWSNIKSKVSNMITTHSAAQRVGANTSNDKVINLDQLYKNSRSKCQKLVKKFHKKRSNNENDSIESSCSASDTSSQIVKNDAFFAKVDLKENEDCDSSDTVVVENEINDKSDFDLSTLKSAFRRSRMIVTEGQNGFDDLRRFVKQGGDFCKELSAILQERSEAELQYAKSLSKLSGKLARACRDGVGGLNEAWKSVAQDMESRAEAHRQFSSAMTDDIVKPLKLLTEAQHKQRKVAEGAVDKTIRGLGDWRAAEAKSKKQSHQCARDNEKLQDALHDVKLSRSTSLIQLAHMHNHKALSDKESAKLEGKKRKAEDAVKKADIEYYTLCVRAERARLEWESAVLRGSRTFQSLEEERLNNLKSILNSYFKHSNEMCPKLLESSEKLRKPISEGEPSKDMSAFFNLRNSSQHVSEQLLPDFYCEHITLAMNRERRKQALIKLLHLIRQDLERERKSKHGLENLSRAIKQTPNFGAEDSQQNVTEKLYHMRSMLTYLEGARYKVQSALAEMENRQRTSHPLAAHITITRDKSGLQQSILKVPQWLRNEFGDEEKPPQTETVETELPDWTDRGMGDGNSNQHDSDFDEFSSQDSGSVAEECQNVPLGQCKALYAYTANLPDELNLHPGDILSVYRKQEDGWWLGECNGCVGIFPATYVENI